MPSEGCDTYVSVGYRSCIRLYDADLSAYATKVAVAPEPLNLPLIPRHLLSAQELVKDEWEEGGKKHHRWRYLAYDLICLSGKASSL